MITGDRLPEKLSLQKSLQFSFCTKENFSFSDFLYC